MKPPPFTVHRTHGNNLPVWREFRQNHTFVSTVVGKIRGDSAPLIRDLQILTGAEVRHAAGGRLQLDGDHYILVKKYLDSVGF